MISIWQRYQRPFKFIIIGGIGALLQLLVLSSLVDGFSLEGNISQTLANITAIFLAAEIVFPLHERITWGDRRNSALIQKRLLRQLFIYNSTRVVAWIVQIVTFLVINLWVSYLLAGVISNIIAAFANYLAGDKLVFKSQ